MYKAEEVQREKKSDRMQMWRENRNRNQMRGKSVRKHRDRG